MPYTITISDLTTEQVRNLNNRLSYVNSGASATSVDDEGKKWRVSVTTSDITYTADGSQTNFSVPFDYLRPSYVHVAINDAEVSEGFTISNRMVMFDSAPTKDDAVHIYRSTPTTRLVSWADASILKAIDMTIAEVQQLHILEETNDWTKTNSIVLNDEGNAWQGRNYRVSNVSDPTEAQDVVTKHYLDNEEGSFTATMNALKTKTEEAANTAATNAKQAKTSETNAKTSETNANTSKEAAQSAANSASNFATDARSSANEAKSYRDASSTYATNAKNYSENVNVFTPSVSEDGILSWTNKAGLPNPPSVNIKGKDGADGGVTVDAALSDSSTNPVQNKVINEALNNRAVLDDTNTFTSPNRFDDIYMQNGINSLKWYDGSPDFVVGYINSKTYTGNAATATKATKDGDSNIITSTYATKTELNSCVKTVNNVAPDSTGNVTITVSGSGSGVTVDEELSSTSTNPVQNKTIYNALLNKAGTDIFSGFDLNSPSATIRWRNGSQNYGILTASNYSGTALRATQDGAGNTITTTYAKKSDVEVELNNKLNKTDTAVAATVATRALQDGNGNVISSTYIKSVNNVTPDENGNVAITVSGGGSNITVDAELSATSTNPVQNKVIKGALDDKANLNKNNTFSKENYFQKGMSLIAYRDLDSAIKWYQSPANPPIASIDATNYTGTAAKATSDGAGNVITETYAKKADVSGVVKSVNGTKPDASGNVTVAVSGGGVSTSESNTWTAQQNFRDLMLNREKYTTYVVNGTSDTPVTSTMVYAVTGAFTLNLATLAGALKASESSVFTAYFAANADYSLTINNAGKLKYVGSASDAAITSSGLLLNIWMSKDGGGTLTSIVQANKLA